MRTDHLPEQRKTGRLPGVLPIAVFVVIAAPLLAAAEQDAFQLEEGFTLLFNGTDLSGWKVRGGDALDGNTEAPRKRFQVIEGKLVIDGGIRGNMVIDTARQFEGDVHIKFQYLPDEKCNNDLYFRGLKFDIKTGNVKNIQFGEWNELEIIVQGNRVEFKNNGQTQRTANAKGGASPLGIRAEFGSIQFRHMRYK